MQGKDHQYRLCVICNSYIMGTRDVWQGAKRMRNEGALNACDLTRVSDQSLDDSNSRML